MPDYFWRCGSPLEVDLDYGKVRSEALFEGGVTNVWKYRALYPHASDRHELELSLGEGGTPLVLASKVGGNIGVEKTWLKCDHLNPSGSFKDRSAAVGVAWALEQGYSGVICASSGNAAGAAAAYAARAGLPVYLVVSEIFFPDLFGDLVILVPALTLSIVVMVVVSLLTPRPPQEILRLFWGKSVPSERQEVTLQR